MKFTRRLRRKSDFELFADIARERFQTIAADIPEHEMLANAYSFSVTPGGRHGGRDKRVVEVFYGQRPFDVEDVPKNEKNLFDGFYQRLVTEHGVTLSYGMVDNGAVLCTLHPAGSKNFARKEDAIILSVIECSPLLTGLSLPTRHWNSLFSYMKCTCLEGEPTIRDKFHVWMLLLTRDLIVDGKHQSSWVKRRAGWLFLFVLTVGFSGWALDLFKQLLKIGLKTLI